jgi:hypothetical protein
MQNQVQFFDERYGDWPSQLLYTLIQEYTDLSNENACIR